MKIIEFHKEITEFHKEMIAFHKKIIQLTFYREITYKFQSYPLLFKQNRKNNSFRYDNSFAHLQTIHTNDITHNKTIARKAFSVF